MKCPNCNEVHLYPTRRRGAKYGKCPKCRFEISVSYCSTCKREYYNIKNKIRCDECLKAENYFKPFTPISKELKEARKKAREEAIKRQEEKQLMSKINTEKIINEIKQEGKVVKIKTKDIIQRKRDDFYTPTPRDTFNKICNACGKPVHYNSGFARCGCSN